MAAHSGAESKGDLSDIEVWQKQRWHSGCLTLKGQNQCQLVHTV
jgi:hypothetical protein